MFLPQLISRVFVLFVFFLAILKEIFRHKKHEETRKKEFINQSLTSWGCYEGSIFGMKGSDFIKVTARVKDWI